MTITNNKSKNLFIAKYLFVLYFFILMSLLLFFLIIIKNYEFKYEQFRNEEIEKYKIFEENFKLAKGIIEDLKEKQKKVEELKKKIKENKIKLLYNNNFYTFFYDENIKNIFFEQKISDGQKKISDELEKITKKSTSKELSDLNKSILNESKKKIFLLNEDINNIDDIIKKINKNNKERILKKFLFF